MRPFFLLLCLFCLPASAHPLEGSWVGWAWLGEAGDLPLQVHFNESSDELTGLVDSPAQGVSGISVTSVAWTPPRLAMSWTTSSGTAIELFGTQRRNELRGELQWGPYAGTFELVKSPYPIARTTPGKDTSAAGFYHTVQDEVFELSSRPWGELLLRNTGTGKVRTLFPLAEDHYFFGSGLYLPDPPTGEVRLIRDQENAVIAIAVDEEDAEEQLAARIELVEEPFSFESDGVELHGTLLWTPGEPRPAVAMLGGSSWETRNDVRFHARNLASMGFAVLSWDKRGHGESGGEPIVPFSVTARDAIAAIGALERDPGIDAARTGVAGISRGGWYAPLAAASSGAIDFAILLVPPAVSPAEQETSSRLDQMESEGFDAETLDLARRLLRATWEWLATEDRWDEYLALRDSAIAAGVPDYVLESDSPERTHWAWGRMNMMFDPCHVLGMLDIPVLAIYGENDLYVDARQNRGRMERCIGPGATLVTHTIPGADHSLAIPNDLPVNRQTGRGDEGYSVIANWAKDVIFAEER